MSNNDSKSSFFRQGAWMIIATVGGGVFMTVVHSVVGQIRPVEEYGVFGALLRLLILLGVPSAGLQVIFARQAAAAIDDKRKAELNSTVRGVVTGIFVLWLLVCVAMIFGQEKIVTALKIRNPLAFWATLVVMLTSLWMPVIKGLLQGTQNFLGLGWTSILEGVGRFAAMCVIVFARKGESSGAMVAVIFGQVVTLGAGLWWTREYFLGPRAPVAWKTWLTMAIPLTLGAGAITFMSTVDSVFVQSNFAGADTPLYIAGYLVGFAVMQFTGPLAVVMFPKVARSAATAQKTDALKITLMATAAVGIAAIIGCAIFPELPLRVIYFRESSRHLWAAAPLVPWFVSGILMLSLANVLVNELLARQRFAIVPWLVAGCILYLGTLLNLRTHLASVGLFAAYKTIIATFAGFNLYILVVAASHVWGHKPAKPS